MLGDMEERRNPYIPSKAPPVNYPFHVHKAIRTLSKLMHFIDTVLVVLDARAPLTTLYKDFKRLFGRHRHVIFVLGKSDLAPEEMTKRWKSYLKNFNGESYPVFSGDLRNPASIKPLKRYLVKRSRSLLASNLLVVGAPNLGKSSLINSLVGRSKVRVGDIPGVTRSLQWLKLDYNLKVLDSPGLMPPIPSDWISYSKLVLLNVVPKSSDISYWRLLKILLTDICAVPPLRERLSALRDIGELLLRTGKLLLSGDEERAFYEIQSLRDRWGKRDLEEALAKLFKDISQGRYGKIALELPPEDS